MRPFWRRDEVTPSEASDLEQYYANQRASNSWLSMLATLLAIVLIGVAVFFSARWLYNKFHSNKPANAPVATQNVAPPPTSNSQPTNPQPANPPANTYTTPSPTTTAPPTTQTAPPATSATPNTGPGNTIAIFLGATVLGAVVYQLRARSQAE